MAKILLKTLDVDQIVDMSNVHIEFDRRFTLLTGPNSAGKTMICGASVLALLGLRNLKSTHWKDKITLDNIARRGVRGGRSTLTVEYDRSDYTFVYHHRTNRPYEVTGPDGQFPHPEDALKQIGLDIRAVDFLTTSERHPPWISVEGNVNEVLRKSLQTTLATRVEGCERVKGVLQREVSSVESKIDSINQEASEIITRWIDNQAFSEEERDNITTSNFVQHRFEVISGLKDSLASIRQLVQKSQALQKVKSLLDEVQDLPILVKVSNALGNLTNNIEQRESALATLQRDRLEVDVPLVQNLVSQATEGQPLSPPFDELLKRIQKSLDPIEEHSQELCNSLGKLEGYNCTPASPDELSLMETQYADEQKKLQRTKGVLKEGRESIDIQCTVYKGEPLLIQLEEAFVQEISYEDLLKAQVIAPYSPEQEKRVNMIVDLLKSAKGNGDALKLQLEKAKSLITQERNTINQQAAEKRGRLPGIMEQMKSLNCPDEKLPDAKTGGNLSEAMLWVDEQVTDVTCELNDSVKRSKEVLANTGLQQWCNQINPFLERAQAVAVGESEGEVFNMMKFDEQVEALKEAVRSLSDYQERFGSLLGNRTELESQAEQCKKGIEALDTYRNQLEFSQEAIERLTQTFLGLVREGINHFDFDFKVDFDDDGKPIFRRDNIEGEIQTGGGETQILGILEMLSVAEEFEFPVFIDEVCSYLHPSNLRKILQFMYEETDVQVVLTTTDEQLLQLLTELGIRYRAYRVEKDQSGYTKVIP